MIIIIFSVNLVSGQLISPVDPFNLIKYEQKNYFQNNRNLFQTLLRPQLIKASNQWSLILRNELFYNDGSPNLENMSNRLVGKGVGIFTGVNLSYSSNFVSFSLEPYYFTNQNKEVEDLNREGVFTRLNDVQQKIEKPFVSFGLRETQLYFHYKELGFGFSNANMWWGPGLHTSLTMTNNTTGFPHIMMGTIREKRYRNVGFNIRYVFSQLDKTENNPYYTALVGTATFYTEPIITIGFNRNMLSSDQSNGKEVSKFDAATILFRQSINIKDTYQTLAAYFILDFPESGLKVFFELGTTDRWQDWTDFLNYPDHGIGSIFGFRQYGLFNNQNFVMGFEYARLLLGSFWEKRPTPNWYGNPLFDYSSYDGRRWAAHSGADSDDLLIYFGYHSDKWACIPAFNFERHGVLYTRPAEVKMELRLDFRYTYREYHLNVFYEREWLEHAGFIPDKWRIGNVIWFGVERDITNLFTDKLSSLRKK